MGLGQYNSLGKYCGAHTASSVFLILVLSVAQLLIIGEECMRLCIFDDASLHPANVRHTLLEILNLPLLKYIVNRIKGKQ